MQPLTLTRTYVGASPERVWASWTTPDGLLAWWWTHWPGVTCELDVRVGGAWQIVAPQQGIRVHGTYTEVEPTTRLGFTWIWADDGVDGPTEDILVVLSQAGEDVRLELAHAGMSSAEAGENYRQGWEFVLDALDRHLSHNRGT